jgi:hypothetical protein
MINLTLNMLINNKNKNIQIESLSHLKLLIYLLILINKRIIIIKKSHGLIMKLLFRSNWIIVWILINHITIAICRKILWTILLINKKLILTKPIIITKNNNNKLLKEFKHF